MGHTFSSQSFVTTAEHAELRERVAVLEEALKRPRDDEREAGREQRQRTGPPTASAAAAAAAAAATAAAEPPRAAAADWRRWEANLQALKAGRGTPVELSDSDDEPAAATAAAEPPPAAAARADGGIRWVDRDGRRVALRADVVQEAQELMRSLGADEDIF